MGKFFIPFSVILTCLFSVFISSKTLASLIEEEKVSSKTLKLGGPCETQDLNQLKNKEFKEISLHGVYEVYKENDIYINKGPITISPETFNPEVEKLSLTVCGLGPQQVSQLAEFKKLRRLVLDCNPLTDKSIPSITALKDLISLSLFSTNITNVALKEILKMPNLVELDIRQNKGVTDEMAHDLLNATNLKTLKVSSTGLSRQIQRKLAEK